MRGEAQVELGRAVLAHTHRFIHAMLAVDAVRAPLQRAGAVPAWGRFFAAVSDALDAAQLAVSADEPPGPIAALRPLQEELAAALLADPGRAGGPDAATALAEATDRITNSIDTLIDELRRQLPLADHSDQNSLRMRSAIGRPSGSKKPR